MKDQKQNVFLVGAKSLGAYGGYETFVNKLTEYHQQSSRLQYHVACKLNGEGCMDEAKLEGVTGVIRDKKGRTKEFFYQNARCFMIPVPPIGPAQAIYYDLAALDVCCRYIEKNKIPHPIVYIMACRIGPLMGHFCRRIHKLGGKVYLNPDGHEWMRTKWSPLVRKYWKLSEEMMVTRSDLVICDSVNIEKYIHESYGHKKELNTTYIAYGAETENSALEDSDPKFLGWMAEKGLKPEEYYLVVGRFVPENNYETVIREFMASRTQKDLALITNVNEKFLAELEEKLHFRNDPRIKFVGTVYDQALLRKIRENAYGYLHGHEVGGTNPSLLEALGATRLNLLLGVGFNREVAREAALYWTKEPGDLAALLDSCDGMDPEQRDQLGREARSRILTSYSWQFIADEYQRVFCPEG